MSIESTEVQPGTEVPEVIETPAPELVQTPPLVEMRYEYQPSDELGRPLGAKQVIKYTTPEGLAAKLAEQNTLLIRKLREETRKNRLGVLDTETIPDDAPRYEEPLSFHPRTLTAEERVRISRDLLDPDKFDEAADTLLEARMGAKPDRVTSKVSDLETTLLRIQAKSECDAFVGDNPRYVKCQENFESITNWMLRYGLAPVKSNFQRAYDKLRADKVLIESYEDIAEPDPVVEPEVIPVPVVETEPLVVENEVIPAPVVETPSAPVEAPKPVQARIPTGLNRNTSDEVGAPRSAGDDIVYEVSIGGQRRRFTGLAAINAMPADEYKRRVYSDPTFAKKEQALEREAAERRRRR